MYLEMFNLWVISEGMLCTHQQQFRFNMWAGTGGDCFALFRHIILQAAATDIFSYMTNQNYQMLLLTFSLT
jgi:hypothetical protein